MALHQVGVDGPELLCEVDTDSSFSFDEAPGALGINGGLDFQVGEDGPVGAHQLSPGLDISEEKVVDFESLVGEVEFDFIAHRTGQQSRYVKEHGFRFHKRVRRVGCVQPE